MNEEKQELALVSPSALYRVATDVAAVCGEIVKKTAVRIRDKRYVKVEGWEAIAAAHGCFAGADSAERVYDNQNAFIGYTAKGYIRNSQGQIIGTGEGFVGFDEADRTGKSTWGARNEYAGRAMAQTRAISRAARAIFAHVVVLIDEGLSTTPAEEVPMEGFNDANIALRQETREKTAFVGREEPLVLVTEGNYGDMPCHVGKIGGEMRDKKVSEIDPNLLGWLAKEYGKKWGKQASQQDANLLSAVKIALSKVPATLTPTEPKSQPTGAEEGGKGQRVEYPEDTSGRKYADLSGGERQQDRQVSPTDSPPSQLSKTAIVVELLERAQKLGLQEAGLCALLRTQGVFDTQYALKSANLATLRYVHSAEGWKVVEGLVEAERAKA